jgi:hypothetical protein
MSSTIWNLFPFRVIFILEIEESLGGIGQAIREVVEGQESNALPRTLKLTIPCEVVHCYDEDAIFPQYIFLVIFFIPHPSHASEPPDNKLD